MRNVNSSLEQPALSSAAILRLAQRARRERVCLVSPLLLLFTINLTENLYSYMLFMRFPKMQLTNFALY